jgi:hypothetical protein
VADRLSSPTDRDRPSGGYHPNVRRVELGLVTQARWSQASEAVGRVLEEPVHEGERLDIGGGRYVSFELFPNLGKPDRERRYADQRDVRFVLRVMTDGDSVNVDQLVRRLSPVEGEWRVLFDG